MPKGRGVRVSRGHPKSTSSTLDHVSPTPLESSQWHYRRKPLEGLGSHRQGSHLNMNIHRSTGIIVLARRVCGTFVYVGWSVVQCVVSQRVGVFRLCVSSVCVSG